MMLAEDLKARGLIEHTSADIEKILGETRTVYLGVDPSADSMQAGNLVVVLLMKRLADAGHKIVLLVGGGTGMIGDPRESGERQLADTSIVEQNKAAIKNQFQQILGQSITLVDNADWLLQVKLVDFLRDIGKHFTINELIKRDIIRRRLETPDDSISYTEFAYSLLQGYDYLELNRTHGVDLQIGASDQWTNILSGVELIRRKESKEAFALTCPLVTDSNGKKFGKSEGNAVWLDAKKTSPFEFYQFWLNQPDEVVEKYLKFYSFMSVEEIHALVERHEANPAARKAQRVLAHAVTEIVHGKEAAIRSAAVSETLYSDRLVSSLSGNEYEAVKEQVPVCFASTPEFTIMDALLSSGLAESRTEARKLVEGNGVSIDGEKVTSAEVPFMPEHVSRRAVLLKKGKKLAVVDFSKLGA